MKWSITKALPNVFVNHYSSVYFYIDCYTVYQGFSTHFPPWTTMPIQITLWTPADNKKITKTQKSIYTLHLIHNFTSILVYATVDVLPDFWMRLLLTSFSMLGVVLDKAQRRSLSTASRQFLCLDLIFNRDEKPRSRE